MAALPRYDELRRAACSLEWEDMFILYCRRAITEDIRLAREINGMCDGLTAVIEERELFIGELDTLVDKFMSEKMCEFLKEMQAKDTNKLMKLQILGREFEIRALVIMFSLLFFFLADDDNSERSERFAEEAFGYAVVPTLVLCYFTRSVSDCLAGMVETIMRATSSMRSSGGVPIKAIVLVI
ncbi:hypothetical protein Tco_1469278 [Tanacetum coccineum]